MLRVEEWLQKVGFVKNPFELKQAEEEGELLSEYFVEHPAFNQILDQNKPRSSVLFASRGTGKSSALQMFTTYWDELPPPRPLFVYLTDWSNLVERVESLDQITTRQHLDELLRRFVLALAQQLPPDQHHPPDQMHTTDYLHWLCTTYNHYITPLQQRILIERSYATQPTAEVVATYASEAFPVIQHMQLLAATARDLGYAACYVLVDNVDELPQTVADWHACAYILENLIGHLRIHEVQGLAFKYFIPTEVFDILNGWHKIRRDRIGCFNLTWSEQQIIELLRNRLTVFSQHKITSLALLASRELTDIDERLSREAGGSPRHLLNLGEWLLQACAADATDTDATIYVKHLEFAQQEYRQWLHQQRIWPDDDGKPYTSEDTVQTAVPLLRVYPDGRVLRGQHEIEGWDRLPSLQRTLLEYLHQHHDRYCRREEIIAGVWKDKATPASDSSLRKLIDRLRQFVEPDPNNPIYIKHLAGGKYRLENVFSEDIEDG
jgi:hypothetical protein